MVLKEQMRDLFGRSKDILDCLNGSKSKINDKIVDINGNSNFFYEVISCCLSDKYFSLSQREIEISIMFHLNHEVNFKLDYKNLNRLKLNFIIEMCLRYNNVHLLEYILYQIDISQVYINSNNIFNIKEHLEIIRILHEFEFDLSRIIFNKIEHNDGTNKEVIIQNILDLCFNNLSESNFRMIDKALSIFNKTKNSKLFEFTINKFDIHDSYYEGMTALLYTCKYNKIDLLKDLINQGVDINQVDKYNRNALHFASSFGGSTELIIYLINKGVNIHTVSIHGNNILHYVSKTGKYQVVRYILDSKNTVNINQQNNHKDTALIIASYNNHYKIVKILVENKADINIQNINGNTALHIACNFKYNKIVSYLINKGADLSSTRLSLVYTESN